LSSDNNSIECAILLYANNLVDVIKIATQVLIVGIIVRPIPSIVYFRPRELIFGNFGVNPSTRITVPSPSTSGVFTSLENHSLHAPVAKSLKHEDTGFLVS